MNKHTPGPWQWDGPVWDYDPEEDAPWLIDSDANIILSGQIKCIGEANARLIAAAPELLEALENAVKEMEGLPHSLGYEFTHLPAMRAAITKATQP